MIADGGRSFSQFARVVEKEKERCFFLGTSDSLVNGYSADAE
ncbi:hypothetical protein ACFLSZ_06980 [Candidatus Bipolaricaulota bacterium]